MRLRTAEDSPAEDAALIGKILSRKEADEASRRLVAKYWKLLVAWVRPRLRDPSEAEDVVQETFIRAFRALGRLEDSRRFLGWLMRIARNQAADQIRRRRDLRSLDAAREGEDAFVDVPFIQEDLGEKIDRAEEVRAVLGAVDRLPPRYRLVVLLKHFQGLSGAEMAEAMGEPEGTIRNRLFRAHEKIRRLVERVPGARIAAGDPRPSVNEDGETT